MESQNMWLCLNTFVFTVCPLLWFCPAVWYWCNKCYLSVRYQQHDLLQVQRVGLSPSERWRWYFNITLSDLVQGLLSIQDRAYWLRTAAWGGPHYVFRMSTDQVSWTRSHLGSWFLKLQKVSSCVTEPDCSLWAPCVHRYFLCAVN